MSKKNANKGNANLQEQKQGSKWKTFWRNVGIIILNKQENKELTASALAMLMSLTLNIVSFLLVLVAVAIPIVFIAKLSWSELTFITFTANIVKIVISSAWGFASALIALVIRGCANEIGREKDKNYLISVFSSLTGFAALIISLIALFKGVG